MSQSKSGITSNSKFVDQVRSNTKSDLIEITEDKLENILLKHLDKLTKVNGWITPLSIFATILTVFLTAEFKDFAGLEKSVWKAIFVISLLSSFVWTIIASVKAINCSKKATIGHLIKEIKNHQEA